MPSPLRSHQTRSPILPRGLMVIVAVLLALLAGRPETNRAPVEVAVFTWVVESGSPLALVSGGVSARNVTVISLRTPALRGPTLAQVMEPPATVVGGSLADTYASLAGSKTSVNGSGSIVLGP